MLRITAEPGEMIGDFAVRMVRLRDSTDGDFIAVHNDHEVLVQHALGYREFLALWGAQVGRA